MLVVGSERRSVGVSCAAYSSRQLVSKETLPVLTTSD